MIHDLKDGRQPRDWKRIWRDAPGRGRRCHCDGEAIQFVVITHLRYNYSGSNWANVTCLDGATGSVLWRYDFGLNGIGQKYGVTRPFIGPDGFAYIGATSLTHNGTQPFTGPDWREFDRVAVKLDIETGAEIWRWSETRVGKTNIPSGSFNGAAVNWIGFQASSIGLPADTVFPSQRLALSDDGTKVFVSLGFWVLGERCGVILDASDGSDIGDMNVPLTDGSSTITSSLDARALYLRTNGEVIVCSGSDSGSPAPAWRSQDDGTYITGSYGLLNPGTPFLPYDDINDVILSRRISGGYPSTLVLVTAYDLSGTMDVISGTSVTLSTIGISTASASTSGGYSDAADASIFSNGDVLIPLGRFRDASNVVLGQLARAVCYPAASGVWVHNPAPSYYVHYCSVDQFDDSFFVTSSDGKCRKLTDTLAGVTESWNAQITGASTGSASDQARSRMYGVHARTFE